jgi:hypothetical protein
MTAQNRRLAITLSGITCILLLPLIAMRFTDEVNWTLLDFVVAGTLLLGACLAFEFFARRSSSTTYRAGIGIAITTAVVIVWLELAVGIFGSPWAGS